METDNEIQIILEGLDENNISSILQKWKEVNTIKKKIEELNEMLKNKIKTYLKERRWNKYKDQQTNINIIITKIKKENFDKKQLKLMLTEAQMAQIINTTTHERLDIITPENRKRMNKYVK